MNLGTSLHWVTTKMGDKIALVERDSEVSYRQLWENIELLAKALLKKGIKESDKVAILLPNCGEFIFSFYALARINAISVPLNQYLTPYELRKIFDECKPEWVITTSEFYDKKLSSFWDGKDNVFLKKDFPGLCEYGKDGGLPDFKASNDHIATINYTYRGLGEPLGAVLTHGNYHYGAIAYVRLTEVVTSQRVLVVTPMSHIFTLVSCVIVSLLRGATIFIAKSFIPSHVFKQIEESKIDFIMAVPTVYISLLKNYNKDKYDISSLKYGITGGSYMSEGLHDRVKRELGIELFQGYGLTETVPVTCNPRSKNKPASLGVPGHKMKIKIMDDTGSEVPVGEKGEIAVGGWTVMKEYYKRNGENKKFMKDGWFYTGDYGWMDEEGYVYFGGLKKDIVKVGGNNVDLKEVQDVMCSFEDIEKVKLSVAEDDLWGHIIEADVKLCPGKMTRERDIRRFCSERMALYKLPKNISIR